MSEKRLPLRLITGFLLGFSGAMLFSQNAEPPKLAQLKVSYQAARMRAVEALKTAYGKELHGLIEIYKRDNKTAEAEGVLLELNRLGATVAQTARPISESTDTIALVQARQKYEKEVAKAAAPIDQVYIKELRKLVEAYNKENNVNDTALTLDELKKAEELVQNSQRIESSLATVQPDKSALPPDPSVPPNNTGGTVPGMPQGGSSADLTTEKDIEKWVMNKTWRSPAGTNWKFDKDGKGEKYFGENRTPFVWKHVGAGAVEVIGSDDEGGPSKTWHFQFDARDKAYYGPYGQPAKTPIKVVR
ncbi:MAG TPA: hypothetical protein VGE39_11620 [Prosthecobacter sp.]